MPWTAFDTAAMQRALELARRGEGHVEPNPLVGAVVSRGGTIIGEGWHARFGGPHAEIAALSATPADAARCATLFVTLEPCCHHGKTPPCTDAIIAAGISRVVIATIDPFAAVNGGGIAALRGAGIAVEMGLCEQEALRLIAPFRKLVTKRKPWVIAKWAMSLDGRMAAPAGTERWLSSAESRAIAHDLRARVDAIVIGIGTAEADDPLLTARPAEASGLPTRPLLRIVLDSAARLPLTSRLVQTAREQPLLVAVGPDAPADRLRDLETAGCEVWVGQARDSGKRLAELLGELGRRQLTNVLVEGGAQVLNSFFAHSEVDEVWAFIAPRIIGGKEPAAPLADLAAAAAIEIEHVSHPGGDFFIRGLTK